MTTWFNVLFRFMIASFELLLVAFIVPGFFVQNFYTAALTVLVMTTLYWLLDGLQAPALFLRQNVLSTLGLLALLLYASQFMIQTTHVTLFGAFIAALFIAMFQAVLPFKAKYWRTRQ